MSVKIEKIMRILLYVSLVPFVLIRVFSLFTMLFNYPFNITGYAFMVGWLVTAIKGVIGVCLCYQIVYLLVWIIKKIKTSKTDKDDIDLHKQG